MRRRNAFTGDKSYTQTWALTYRDTVTESRCAQDWTRLVPWILVWWRGGILLLAAGLWLWERASSLQTLSLLFLVAVSTKTQGLLLTRTVWLGLNVSLGLLVFPHSNWTQADFFASTFPGFMCSKSYLDLFLLQNWRFGLLASTAEALLLAMLGSGQLTLITLPLLLWTAIAVTLEKDRRDYWALGDSYRRSEGHYKDLFNYSKQAIFVVSLDGTILYTNSGAKRLNRLLRKTPLQPNIKIQSFFQEDNQAKITEMLSSAQKGENDEKEFILKKLPTGILFPEELQGLGLEIRTQPFPWKDQNAVLITCEDVSLFIVRRLFLAGVYKQLHEQAAEFTEQLESLRCMKSPVDVTALCSYQMLCIEYGNALALQYFMLGRAEMRREGFHVRSELEAIMEFAYYSACKNNVDLLLTREDGFPTTVFGARLQHEKLLADILGFAINHAIPGSEVSLLCSVEVASIQSAQHSEIWLGYRLVFRTTELKKEDFDLILLTRKQEVKRRTLQDAITIYNRFGLSAVVIDALLLMLHGHVISVTYNMLEHSFTIKFQYCLYREFPLISMQQRQEALQ